MNAYDYLLGNTEFLHKDFILGNKETLSYAELNGRSLKLARYLMETYGEGNNIILAGPNSAWFIVAYLAIIKSGNVCVPLNPAIEKENLDYIVDLCGVKAAFVAENLKNRDWSGIDAVIHEYESLNGTVNRETLDLLAANGFDEERLAEVIFTSGSTGEPKGVMITHRNIRANTESIIEYLNLSGDDVMEVVLPFYYCYGLSLLHTHLRVGGSIVLNNTFMFVGSVIRDLNDYACTGFAGVPSHFQILLRKTRSFKETRFPHLKYVTQAGGKLHNAFISEFTESFPQVQFFVMYGQTEATARLSYLDPARLPDKLGSIGKAIPGVELDLRDESDNPVRKSGEVGELVARGGNIMIGYLGDAESTGRTLRDGWLHTGDLAYRDGDGYFFLTARKKEIIKVGGRRISPKEIEEVIVSIPGVVDCSIHGIFDEYLGESLRADIVLADAGGSGIDEAYVKKYCGERLAMEKVPGIIRFKSSLEVASTGKKVKKSGL